MTEALQKCNTKNEMHISSTIHIVGVIICTIFVQLDFSAQSWSVLGVKKTIPPFELRENLHACYCCTWAHVEEPVPSPMYIGISAICHMPNFNKTRRCQKIYTRAIVALGTMSRSQRLDLRGKAGHPVARESPLFLLVSDFRESPFEPPNQAILFTYDKWLDIEIIAKVGFPIPMRLRRISWIFIIFLAVQDSSIGDLVTQRFLIVDTSRH